MTATVGTALEAAVRRLYAAGIDTARLDARLLLGDVLQLETADLVAHPERPLATLESERFRDLIERRCRHQPVSQLLARREFWGLAFRVTADTLIPRPETEVVVEQALAGIADRSQPIRILDLGTGTGCLLLTLLHELPQATGLGIDRSPGALAVARANAAALGLAEETDAVVIVVSEETGAISIANKSELKLKLDAGQLRSELATIFNPRPEESPEPEKLPQEI